jgi:hypothetical protein
VKHAKQHFRRLSRGLCYVAIAGAVGSLLLLLGTDSYHMFGYREEHSRISAIPLAAIGCAYIFLQFSGNHRLRDLLKSLCLGLAFVFWGFEVLVPPSRLLMVMDNFVVGVFVLDLAVIIIDHLKCREHEIL